MAEWSKELPLTAHSLTTVRVQIPDGPVRKLPAT